VILQLEIALLALKASGDLNVLPPVHLHARFVINLLELAPHVKLAFLLMQPHLKLVILAQSIVRPEQFVIPQLEIALLVKQDSMGLNVLQPVLRIVVLVIKVQEIVQLALQDSMERLQHVLLALQIVPLELLVIQLLEIVLDVRIPSLDLNAQQHVLLYAILAIKQMELVLHVLLASMDLQLVQPLAQLIVLQEAFAEISMETVLDVIQASGDLNAYLLVLLRVLHVIKRQVFVQHVKSASLNHQLVLRLALHAQSTALLELHVIQLLEIVPHVKLASMDLNVKLLAQLIVVELAINQEVVLLALQASLDHQLVLYAQSIAQQEQFVMLYLETAPHVNLAGMELNVLLNAAKDALHVIKLQAIV